MHSNFQRDLVLVVSKVFSLLTDVINTFNVDIIFFDGITQAGIWGPSITIMVAIDNVGVGRCTSAITLFRQHVQRQ